MGALKWPYLENRQGQKAETWSQIVINYNKSIGIFEKLIGPKLKNDPSSLTSSWTTHPQGPNRQVTNSEILGHICHKQGTNFLQSFKMIRNNVTSSLMYINNFTNYKLIVIFYMLKDMIFISLHELFFKFVLIYLWTEK